MEQVIKAAYAHVVQCEECDKTKVIYYTIPDFGDPPYIRHCRHCGELYWYTPEDEAYVRPLAEQLKDVKCVACGTSLRNTLVPTHRHIKCCGREFSLDDDFPRHLNPSSEDRVLIEVYLIYS